MKLESVLTLKAELADQMVTNASPIPHVMLRAAGAAARRVEFAARLDATHTRRPESAAIALGVASGNSKGDFRLGARIHVGGEVGQSIGALVQAAARGEADVRIVPRVRKRFPRRVVWFRGLHRPLESGLSVGHHKITAGTIGAVVEDQHAFYILSNNHVLANLNEGQPGDPVVQPGPIDIAARRKVSTNTLVGVLDRFVPISFNRANVVDCAVAALDPELEFFVGWTEALPGVVKGVREVSTDDLNLPVSKAGRTTGVRLGRITQVNVDRLQVDMGDAAPRIALFSDQIEIEGDGRPFSESGDSGSLIVDRDGFGRALLFAGGAEEGTGRDLTFANQLHIVLQKLGVTLAL